MGWGKNQNKIHARENTKKKNSCKEEGKEVQRVSPAKKIPAQAKSEKKNSCKLKFLSPHHFSNGPSLNPILHEGGGGHKVPALISNEESFGNIKVIVTKSRDFS